MAPDIPIQRRAPNDTTRKEPLNVHANVTTYLEGRISSVAKVNMAIPLYIDKHAAYVGEH